MDYPIKFGDQLKQQLRSLRKARGLNQTELGVRLGVTQRRIAEIEANPSVVAVDQIIKIFSALGAELVLRELSTPPAEPLPSSAATDDTRAPREFRASLASSARDLVAHLQGRPTQSPALLVREHELTELKGLQPRDKTRLIDALAKALLVNARLLEGHLATALPAGGDGTGLSATPIHDQWARALAVSPETLRQAVNAAIASRHAPVGLGTSPSRGAW